MIRNTMALKRGANTSPREDQKGTLPLQLPTKYGVPTLTSRLDVRAVTLSFLRQGYESDHCNVQLYMFISAMTF